MKKILIYAFLILASGGLQSCEEEDFCTFPDRPYDEVQLAADIQEIDQYLSDNQINAVEHPSGLRYEILKEGNGRVADGCSTVRVWYKGYRLDGYVFDSLPLNQTIDFPLKAMITGWQIGIPMIEPGGEIRLYIPSVYGYGPNGSGTDIPPDTQLIFDVTLYAVYN